MCSRLDTIQRGYVLTSHAYCLVRRSPDILNSNLKNVTWKSGIQTCLFSHLAKLAPLHCLSKQRHMQIAYFFYFSVVLLFCKWHRTTHLLMQLSWHFLCNFVLFWATVCKTVHPMLSDRCLSVTPVCLSILLWVVCVCAENRLCLG